MRPGMTAIAENPASKTLKLKISSTLSVLLMDRARLAKA
jgi:hypothetical protein